MNIIAISGSLRKDSYNTALLRALMKAAPEMNIGIADISTLPLFNEELEEPYPAVAQALRDAIASADGILIATPEYNRTIPAPLKNFFDWMSRPDYKIWNQKPVGVLGSSSGPRGASFAQYDVRRILHYFNARALNQPEFYLGMNEEKFDASLTLSDAKTNEVLAKFVAAFKTLVASAR